MNHPSKKETRSMPTRKKVTTLDRAACALISKRIAEALAPLAEELGVSIRTVGGTFTASQLTCKVEVATLGDDGTANTRAADDFRVLAPLMGMSAGDLGRTFRSGGRTFTISGMRSRASRRPVIARADNGREFCFAIEDVKLALSVAS